MSQARAKLAAFAASTTAVIGGEFGGLGGEGTCPGDGEVTRGVQGGSVGSSSGGSGGRGSGGSGGRGTSIKASSSLISQGSGAEALAGTCRSLIGRMQACGTWDWGGLRNVRRCGALGCLEEVWFLMGLASAGGGDQKSATPKPTLVGVGGSGGGSGAGSRKWDIGDEGGVAAVSLYWHMLAGIAPADTRQLVGACAFAPGFLPWLWGRLSASLPTPRDLPMTTSGVESTSHRSAAPAAESHWPRSASSEFRSQAAAGSNLNLKL